MPPLAIVIRILANPIANVLQKQLTQRSAHPVFIIAVVHAVLAVICLPYVSIPGALHLSAGVWTNMVVAALLAVGGNVLLVYALSETDLSILGPINAYKSVVSLILGVFLIGERPTPIGLVGVLLIVAGSYFVIDREVHEPLCPSTMVEANPERSRRDSNAFLRFFNKRGIQLRFAALLLSATEAIFLKRAIVQSSPVVVFVLWAGLGFAMALVWVLVTLRRELSDQFVVLQKARGTFALLAVATGAMQLATVLTFRNLQVGYSLALFQMSTIVSVLLGRRYFAETNIGQRLLGSIVMAAGAALIVVFGHQN